MLTLFRPQRELSRVSREFDDLFNFAWPARRSNGHGTNYTPSVDIEENDEAFVLTADLPGVDQKEIDIQVEDGVLVLSGKREAEKKEQSENSYYRELRYGSFSRQFRLGDAVDTEQIGAQYKNGVLTVTLPKKEQLKPRQIEIEVK